MAEPASAATQNSGAIQVAIKNIAQQLKRPLVDRQLTYNEGQVIRSFLDHAHLQPKDTYQLFEGLAQAGVRDQFYQTAHPRWGPFVREWLERQRVPWATIHSHYQYDVRDSLDFFFGFVF